MSLALRPRLASPRPAAARSNVVLALTVGRINYRSKVLDLGCGKGQSVKLIAGHTGATCVGLDLGTENIRRAKEVASQMPDLKMTFHEGSFTELPAEILAEKFDVIFSQACWPPPSCIAATARA